MVELSQAIRHLMFLLIYSQFGRIKIIKAAALHILCSLAPVCPANDGYFVVDGSHFCSVLNDANDVNQY